MTFEGGGSGDDNEQEINFAETGLGEVEVHGQVTLYFI